MQPRARDDRNRTGKIRDWWIDRRSHYRLHNRLRELNKRALRTCLIATPPIGVPVRSGFYPALLQKLLR